MAGNSRHVHIYLATLTLRQWGCHQVSHHSARYTWELIWKLDVCFSYIDVKTYTAMSHINRLALAMIISLYIGPIVVHCIRIFFYTVQKFIGHVKTQFSLPSSLELAITNQRSVMTKILAHLNPI